MTLLSIECFEKAPFFFYLSLSNVLKKDSTIQKNTNSIQNNTGHKKYSLSLISLQPLRILMLFIVPPYNRYRFVY